MTSPARQAEADRVELVYYYTLNELGAQTVDDAIELWYDLPPDEVAELGARWLDQAILLILTRREQSRSLALGYYRLVRALRTGTTIADPRTPEPTYVSLETLRQEFEALVDETLGPEPQEPSPDAQNAPETDEQDTNDLSPTPEVEDALEALSDEDDDDEDDRILVEMLDELEALITAEDDAAEQEAETVIQALGPDNLGKKLDGIDDQLPAREHAAEQAEAQRQAGARMAAAAERITLNAARGLTYQVGEADPKVIGWVRYSQTGDPCGWCAMLISRGLTAKYGSETGATTTTERRGKNAKDETDQYHDNCHCVAIPVYSQDHFDSSSLFEMNRKYRELWDTHIKGKFHGKDALTEWRALLRRMAREQDPTPVQEAA